MIKRESQFTILLRHWLRKNYRLISSCALELKQTQTDSIAFNVVKEHQIAALLAIKHRSLLYKAPDDSRGIKPFDMFHMKHCPAYVVIRYPDFFCFIDIDDFIVERDIVSNRKSLMASRAREIAQRVVILNTNKTLQNLNSKEREPRLHKQGR